MNPRTARIVLWVVMTAACTGETGPAGPEGPEGPTAGAVSSITAGDGLAGGTITTSGTVSIAPLGVISTMIADGAVTPEKVGFSYAASASKGGAAADSVLLGGLAATEFAASSHAHVAASVTDFESAAAAAVASAGISGDLAVSGDVTVNGGVTAAGPIVAGGSVQVGTSAAACAAASAGAIRFTGMAFEGCNGTAWVALGAPPPSVSYTRWGRSDCPGDASAVYSGYAAGRHYTQSGSGGNLLCLTSAPVWSGYSDAIDGGALVYGVEFMAAGAQGTATGLADRFGYNATCAVCVAPRTLALMIPGTNACPSGWTIEYSGYLMADHYTHAGTEFACVDASPEMAGSAVSQFGALWYLTEASCGSLPCGPYVQNRELRCAVCTR